MFGRGETERARYVCVVTGKESAGKSRSFYDGERESEVKTCVCFE